MSWQFTPVVLLYLLAALVALGLAYRAWNMRPSRGATSFALVMLACCVWSLAVGVQILGTSLTWKLVLTRISYLGITATAFFWGLFALVYSHYERWLNRRTLALLAVIPLGTYLLVLTMHWHPLFYRSTGLVQIDNLWLLDKTYGPAFWIWAVYAYLAIFGGYFVLIQAVLRFPHLFRQQAYTLILATLLPMSLNLLYVSGHNPLAPFDPSPFTFSITGVLIMWGMRRFQFLDVVPVAHHLVFRHVNAGVILIDNKGRIIEINPAAERILHRTQDQVLGHPIFDALPEQRSALEAFRDVMAIKTEITLGVDPETYELQITPLTDRTGKLAGRIIMLYDVTERKQLIEELDAYAHTVAHDLKNPLTILIGYARLLERNVGREIPAAAQLPLDAIRESSYKMQSIIDELLTLASVRDMDEVQLAPLDTAALVDGALSRLLHVIQETNADIQIPDTWPVAVGHAPWVEEVWANYISNAIKYGGSPPRVELGAERLPPPHPAPGDGPAAGLHRVRFWVRDNGRGLSQEEQAQLFVKFSRLDLRRRAEGHGLGLSIVQRIVKKLGGTVGVESQVGAGSTFYFTLPLAPEPDRLDSTTAYPEPSADLPESLATKR